ncbi:MAG: hypothetical protein KGJ02_00235 [Verrucomicrobiota bacterium]|nr:hypothetical protein [Verrucomicrobiota bacterium]
MSTQLDDPSSFNNGEFQNQLPQHYRTILGEFQRISRSFVKFNLLFSTLSIMELAILPIASGSALIALVIGALFLTCFSYLVLLFYYQAKKPEQLTGLLRRFIDSCRTSLGLPSGVAQHHLSIAETLLKLSNYLQDYEWQFIKIPSFFPPLNRLISRFSAYCHWHDVFRFKQMLLHAAIEEQLKQIQATPTDLEVHASLASTYIALSQIYKEPKNTEVTHPRLSIYRKHAVRFEEQFKTAAKLAIEELEILNQYAPNDPWVHEQLSTAYRELELYEEEIREVEFLLKLRPLDRETLFRLGTLYFQQGMNAKGLQVYEDLRKANFKKAEHLIASYGRGTHSQHELSPISI